VRALGKAPDSVEIWFEQIDAEKGRRTSRRMFQAESEPDRFQFEFRQVPGSFQFWVEGGDDTDGAPVYTVRSLIPPTIEEIRAQCVYPPYTGLPSETFREGDLDLPLGTRVELTLRMNMPLISATLVRDEDEPEALTLSPDRSTVQANLLADRTFRYTFKFTGREGQKNLADTATFRIRGVPDRKPLARILHLSLIHI